jgi:hypothetical protein
MTVRVIMDGFADFAAALGTLPQDMTTEAKPDVRAAADATLADVQAGYAVKSGAMRAGVKQQTAIDRPNDYAIDVKSTNFHANFWEKPTVDRYTKKTHAHRGVSPGHPGRTLKDAEDRHQPPLQQAIAAILTEHGFKVDA